MKPEAFIQRIRDDFRAFIAALWSEVGLDAADKAPLEEIDLDMCWWMQHGPALRGVQAFRGIGKTTLLTCGYSTFRLFVDPDIRIKVISKSAGHAVAMVSQVREWIDNVWFLQDLIPDPKRRHRDKEGMFDVGPCTRSKDPSLMAVGIDGQITGTRAHLLIPDDIETMENTKTLAAREDLHKKTSEFRKIASFGKCEIVPIGTPHHEESVYDSLRVRGYKFRVYPMILPPAAGDFARGKVTDWAPIVTQRIDAYETEHGVIPPDAIIPTVPRRWGTERVLDALKEGPIDFAMQMQCIAKLGEGFRYLRLSDLIVPDFDFRDGRVPLWIKWGLTTSTGSTAREDIERVGLGSEPVHRPFKFPDPAKEGDQWGELSDIRMRIDPSGGGADETAYAVAGFLAGFVWALDVGGFAGGGYGASDEVMTALCEVARRLKVRRITIEDNFGGGTFAQVLTARIQDFWIQPKDQNWPTHPLGWRCQVENATAGRASKEERILARLSPVMAQHRLVVHQDAIRPTPGLLRKYELQYQLSAITKTPKSIPHDDRVEVLADVVGDFVDLMGGSPSMLGDRLAEQKRIDLIEKNLVARMGGFAKPRVHVWNPSMANEGRA